MQVNRLDPQVETLIIHPSFPIDLIGVGLHGRQSLGA